MIKKFIGFTAALALSFGFLMMPTAAQAVQTSGRIVPLKVVVNGDVVTFDYRFENIGANPANGATAFNSFVSLFGCDLDNDGIKDRVAYTTQTRTGTFTASVTAKASELGSDWKESLVVYEDFKEGWTSSKVNADSRLQFSCGVPNTSSFSITYDSVTPPPDPIVPPPDPVEPVTPTIGVTKSGRNVLATISPDCGQSALLQHYSSSQWNTVTTVTDTAKECAGTKSITLTTTSPGYWRVKTPANSFSREAKSATMNFVYTISVAKWSYRYGTTKVGSYAYVTAPKLNTPGVWVRYYWYVGGVLKDRDRSLKIYRSWLGKSVYTKIVMTKSGYKPVVQYVKHPKVYR